MAYHVSHDDNRSQMSSVNIINFAALEIVEPSKRVLAGTLAAMSYSLGEMIIGFAQFLTMDWKNTIRILYTPFLLVFSFYWIVPESVRWLLSKKRPDEAVNVLQKMAKLNGTTLNMQQVKLVLACEMSKTDVNDKAGKYMFLQLLRSKIMRWRVAASYFTW